MKNKTNESVTETLSIEIPTKITIEWLQLAAKSLLSEAEAKVAAAEAEFKAATESLNALKRQAGLTVEESKSTSKTHQHSVKASHFTFVKDLKAGLAGQQLAILELIKAAGEKGISREDLIVKMTETITTKMKHSLLLSFYQKPLVDNGNIVIA